MKVSYTTLQEYFGGKLPSPESIAEALTFHAWEIESIDTVGSDTVLDVKVLPDKSSWALSHRGIAKDLSVILNIPLAHDPLSTPRELIPKTEDVTVDVTSPTCTRYTSALIRGVTVGESPTWLKDFLASMGQRSINNVVDATNYVMFTIGQPLHAFDAEKLSHTDGWKITVRNAREGESITTLTGDEYELSTRDTLIVDGGTDTPVGIAGIKGGKVAEVDTTTVDILLESANFDPVKTRLSSQRLKLRTDASQRYENGVVREMAGYGVVFGAEFITKFCGGVIVGYTDTNSLETERKSVSVSLAKVNRVLGLTLSMSEVTSIIERFGYAHITEGETITITPPFERPDLVIPEDVIEEIGRIYGYEHVPSVAINPIPLREINPRFFYSEAVRDALTRVGFSEVFTSSFRDQDQVRLKNALASDKGYLRSTSGIIENMKETLAKNAPMADLFGGEQVRLFEIGTVFTTEGERYVLVIGAQSKSGFVQKKDAKALEAAKATVQTVLPNAVFEGEGGVWCVDLGHAIASLPLPSTYASHQLFRDVSYKPFSQYPYLTRDVAFWTPSETSPDVAYGAVKEHAGPLAIRIDQFDRFEKDGRVSYGFRIVFQSDEKTLESAEADTCMQAVHDALRELGYEVR